MRLRIKVKARARRSRLVGKVGDEWKLEVAAPPIEGEANREVIAFLAKSLRVPRSAVRIVAGQRSAHKIVEILGIEAERFRLLAGILKG